MIVARPGHRGEALAGVAWAAGLALLSAPPALAQRFSVTVVDSASGAPIEGALVRFADPRGAALIEGTTTSAGTLSGTVYVSGPFLLTVLSVARRAVLDRRIELSATARVDLTVRMVPLTVQLPPLEVTAEAPRSYLSKVGFYDRARLGQRFFLDPEEVARRQPGQQSIADLLAVIPGVSIRTYSSGRIGSVVHLTGMASLNADVACHVEAIEAYRRPSEVPPEWGGAESGCGVLLIWSKHAAPAK